MEPYFIQNPDLSESGPGLRVTWLGHATVLVEIDGLNVLTDPIFSQRASPVQFMGPRRYRGPPCTVEQVEELSSKEADSLPATFSLPPGFITPPPPSLPNPNPIYVVLPTAAEGRRRGHQSLPLRPPGRRVGRQPQRALWRVTALVGLPEL